MCSRKYAIKQFSVLYSNKLLFPWSTTFIDYNEFSTHHLVRFYAMGAMGGHYYGLYIPSLTYSLNITHLFLSFSLFFDLFFCHLAAPPSTTSARVLFDISTTFYFSSINIRNLNYSQDKYEALMAKQQSRVNRVANRKLH